jgi:hypothetical protein
MTSSLDHPLVRDYLADLETVLAGLPPAQAADLREQISAHLEDGLPPGADDDTVAEVLARLGPPGELAATPAGPAPADLAARRARRKRIRRTGIVLGVVALIAAAWPSYTAIMNGIAPLQARGASAWWYPQDTARQARTEADGVVQLTVPIRSAERQGFVVEVYNPSSWTQTIVGPATEFSPGSPYGRLAVSRRPVPGDAGALRAAAYGLPGVIPPHQSRAIRLMWVSIECDERGGGQVLDALVLQVRVGMVTRTEDVSLQPTWAVYGPSTGTYALSAPACQ